MVLDSPKIMGILNVTPDSFYDGGQHNLEDVALEKVSEMIDDGADIIDIGGYSTRPGAQNISIAQECNRVLPILRKIKKAFPETWVSVDTFRSEVAKKAIAEGADMINDVSGGSLDDNMFSLVAQHNIPYVLMHMRGTPETMSQLNHYEAIAEEVLEELKIMTAKLGDMGSDQIIIDLGFGFAKVGLQNYELLKNLDVFHSQNRPILVGISRKSMIYKYLGTTADKALNGTTVLNTFALLHGASILRVHDVKEAAEAIKITNTLK